MGQKETSPLSPHGYRHMNQEIQETKKNEKKAGRRALAVFLPVLTFLTVLTGCAVVWTLSQWGGLTMDEIIYELGAPLEGTGNGMIESFLLRCVLPTVLATASVIFAVVKFRRKPVFRKAGLIAIVGLLAVEAAFLGYFGKKVKLIKFLRDRSTVSDFIEQNYADPRNVKLTFPEKKRNLIFIYLESVESTFTSKENGGSFDRDVIPELTEIAKDNEDFSGNDDTLNGGYSMPGTTWTIGAMFGMTSGLPLNVNIERNAMSSQTTFFPQIRTMGDILKDAGYRQILLLGSDATFGGRRLYFETHGNYEMRDYVWAKETGYIPEFYKVWWGFEDEKLFDLARTTVTELASGDEPFNLTMLTVDTHFTDGYTCRLCGNEFGSNQYANVFACSSRQVSEFIKWCQEQDFYENTTIVLTGDHPTMDADFCAQVPEDYTRRTYTAYINSAVTPKEPDSRRLFSTFDNFPTTLAAMGVGIKGERLGLGTNLFSSEETLSEKYGEEFVDEEVSKRTEFLDKLEALDPETEEKVEKYGSVEVKSVSYDDMRHWITITTGPVDLPEDVDMKYIRLKIWNERGGQIIRRWIKTKPTEEGGFYTTFDPRKDLDEFDEIYYQFVIKLETGESFNLGPEGTVDNFTWEKESRESLAEQQDEGAA